MSKSKTDKLNGPKRTYRELARLLDFNQLVSLSLCDLSVISGPAQPETDSLFLSNYPYSYTDPYSYANLHDETVNSIDGSGTKLFFPPSLKRLEIRDAAPRAPTICKVIVKSMPDLFDLRLGNGTLEDTVDNPFLFHYNLIGFEVSIV